MPSLSTLPKGDSAWLLRKAIERIMQQVSVLETNIGSSTTGNSSNGQVIFNDNGTLRGDADMTFNTALNRLIVSSLEVSTTATITGNLTVDTNTLFVDAANNRVGIGTVSPGATFSALIGSEFLHFGFGANNDNYYTVGASGTHIWRSSSTEQMRLNSTGLGVGGSPLVKLSVVDTVNTFAATFRGNIGTDIVAIGTTALGASINAYTAGFGAATNLVLQPNGGNVGIGVAPSAWNSNYNALDIGQNGNISGRLGTSNTVDIVSNGFRNSPGNWVYKLATSNAACRYQLDGSTGSHIWYSGAAGTAGNTIAGFSSALMTLDASGNLILQPPSSPPTLGTNGQLTVNATSNTNLRFSYRGSDGTTRVANITLA